MILSYKRGRGRDKSPSAETWANARLHEVITLAECAKIVGINAVYSAASSTAKRPLPPNGPKPIWVEGCTY